jgi:hypothetical protein
MSLNTNAIWSSNEHGHTEQPATLVPRRGGSPESLDHAAINR